MPACRACSDPGQVLVELARCKGAPVEVIPGPSACVTALVLSGIPSDQFFFEGFLPRKHGERVRRLQRLAPIPGALIFYESPHRVEASLKAIAEVFPQRTVALCRELTKLHEEVLRAPAPELHERVRERGELKGEMVIVVAAPTEVELERHEVALAAGTPAGVTADPDDLLRSDIAEGLPPAIRQTRSPSACLKSTPAKSATCTTWHSSCRAKLGAAMDFSQDSHTEGLTGPLARPDAGGSLDGREPTSMQERYGSPQVRLTAPLLMRLANV